MSFQQLTPLCTPLMKIILLKAIFSALSNTICVMASPPGEAITMLEDSQEVAVTKRSDLSQKATQAFPWLLPVLLVVLTTFEVGAQKIAQKIAANKNTQFTDNENFIFENPKDVSAEQDQGCRGSILTDVCLFHFFSSQLLNKRKDLPIR